MALWRCPKCGARLIQRNLSHACGRYSIDAFLADKGARARLLFERFVALVAACGLYEVAAAKTRIAFMTRVRFASVNRVTDDAIDIHFVLPRLIKSKRFLRVERVGNLYVHHLRLYDDSDFDRELQEWLRQSHDEYGDRNWLKRT